MSGSILQDGMGRTMNNNPMNETNEKLINANEAAELLGIVPSAFRWHARKGRIVAAQVVTMGENGGLAISYYRKKDVIELGRSIRPQGKPGRGRPRKNEEK